MDRLCNSLLLELVKNIKPDESVRIFDFVVNLYSGETVAVKFNNNGFLNILITDNQQNLFSISLADMVKKDSSHITGIWEKEEKLWAYHWKGFTSIFNPPGFVLEKQMFTK